MKKLLGSFVRRAHLVGYAILLATSAFAQDIHPKKEDVSGPKKEYSPYVEDHFPNQVYFGDTHLHTSWSADAGMAGATLGPDEAYRVSRGETVTAHSGWKVKLIRPLDFLVVAIPRRSGTHRSKRNHEGSGQQ